MSCNETRDWSGAVLLGEAREEPPARITAHLRSCAECRRDVAAAREDWEALGRFAVPAPAPDPDFERTLRDAVGSHEVPGRKGGHMEGATTVAAWAASVILALGLGGVVGWGAGRTADGPGAASPEAVAAIAPPAESETDVYLLLIRETAATLDVESRVGVQALVAEYGEWAGALAVQGALVGAEKLASAGVAVSRDGVDELAGVQPGFIGGYFLVRASTPEEAVAIARQSPHVRYGGVVEVRAIENTTEGP